MIAKGHGYWRVGGRFEGCLRVKEGCKEDFDVSCAIVEIIFLRRVVGDDLREKNSICVFYCERNGKVVNIQ